MDFDTALARYIERLAARCEANRVANYPNTDPRDWYADKGGRKYIRIVRADYGSRSVYSFVEKATGLIWKADGWKGPTKNFSRGSIYDEKPEMAGSIHGL